MESSGCGGFKARSPLAYEIRPKPNYFMRKFCLFLFLSALVGMVQAQNIIKSLEQPVPGQGRVTIHQDPRIEALLGMEYVATGEQMFLKSTGYRVQVYAGNNSRTARNEATNMSLQVKEYFPELATYAFFASPRWLCRVGDFRSIEEADAMMRKLRATGVFKEVSIVKDQINIPL